MSEYVELTDAEKAFIASKSPANDETQGWEYALLRRAVGMVVRDRMAQAWNEGHDECCAVYVRHCASASNPYSAPQTADVPEGHGDADEAGGGL